MKISGLSKSGEIKFTVNAPSIEPINTSGTIGPINLKSIFPARKNVNILVKFPNVAASLFVAIAVAGGSPANKSAGNVINPPPPTIELINAPKNPKTIKIMTIEISKSPNIGPLPLVTTRIVTKFSLFVNSSINFWYDRINKFVLEGFGVKNLIQQLKNMNFNEYEAKAYISLVKQGTVTAYQVSKDSGVPRSRIYEILDVLVEKGIVIKEEIDESIQYSPLPVDVFLQKVQSSWIQNFQDISVSLKEVEKIENLSTNRVMTLKDPEMIISYCQTLLKKAKKRIIISMWDDMYDVLKEDLEEAAKHIDIKGLTIHVNNPVSTIETHRPTQFTEALTSEHWFILSIDAQEMIYGPSLEARNLAFYTNDPVHIYLLEDYIWHDVLVNRIVKGSNEDLDRWIAIEREKFFEK